MKKYIIPIISKIELSSLDVITTSGKSNEPESLKSHISGAEDWPEDPPFDPDDEIIW